MKVHNNDQYQELIDEVDDLGQEVQDEHTFLIKLNALDELSKSKNDPILKAVVAYHQSDIPYKYKDFETCKKEIKNCLRLCKETNFTYYIMRCYNSLAIIDSQCADFYSSITNYLKAFHVADNHPEFQYGSILLNNIGNLFVWLKEYESAIKYLTMSYDKYYEEKLDSIYVLSIIVLNIVEENSLLHNFKEAKKWAELPIPFIKDVDDSIQMILSINAIYEQFRQGKNSLEPHVKNILNHASEEENFIYVFRNYMRLLKYAIEYKNKKLADLFIERCDAMSSNALIVTFSYEYTAIKYRYYEAFQEQLDNGSIAKDILKNYVAESEHVIKQFRNTYNRRLIIESELMKVTNEKEAALNQSIQLQKDIELDYFTHILNKVSLEKHIDEAICMKQANMRQAMFLIDVDGFKEVNDTFGHTRGDELLLLIVEAISSCCSKQMIFGRFGGDEFILYVKNAEQRNFFSSLAEELLGCVKHIQLSENKHITLSIGIFIVENQNENFKTMLQKVDLALYKAKDNGRNTYVVYDDNRKRHE